MKSLRVQFDARYRHLALSVGFALLLLAARVKISHSAFYLFLVWNLFLAAVPFLITQALRSRPWLFASSLALFCAFSAWLLFLPNSPYIITDLIHLQSESSYLRWLDLFLVFVFALNGLLFGILSVRDMFFLLRMKYSVRTSHILIFTTCMLSGFGVYLGRFLRFNSWDILTRPQVLLKQIAQSLHEPNVWLMTLAFGGFLWIAFLLSKSIGRKMPLQVN